MNHEHPTPPPSTGIPSWKDSPVLAKAREAFFKQPKLSREQQLAVQKERDETLAKQKNVR